MEHFYFQETPVERMNYYSKKWGINLFVKRDDIFQVAGGGSKARMLQYILYKVKHEKYNVLITAGSPSSNFNRAAALMTAKMNLKFVLILYSDHQALKDTSVNLYLTNLCGAEIRECDKNSVPDTIDNTLNEFLRKGYKPYYSWGGGKSLEGSYAFFEAISNLRKQVEFKFDHIVAACGTGTTLSGIYTGVLKFFPETNVIGISIARENEKELPVFQQLVNDLLLYINYQISSENKFKLFDDFILGGYGFSNYEQLELIKSVAENEGILFDPVYSGKAFYGLSMLIKKGYIKKIQMYFSGIQDQYIIYYQTDNNLFSFTN